MLTGSFLVPGFRYTVTHYKKRSLRAGPCARSDPHPPKAFVAQRNEAVYIDHKISVTVARTYRQTTTSAPNAAKTERRRGVRAWHVACHGPIFVQVCHRTGADVIAMDMAFG